MEINGIDLYRGKTVYHNVDEKDGLPHSIKATVTMAGEDYAVANGWNLSLWIDGDTVESFSDKPLYRVMNPDEKRCTITKEEAGLIKAFAEKVLPYKEIRILATGTGALTLRMEDDSNMRSYGISDGLDLLTDYIQHPLASYGFTGKEAEVLENLFLELSSIPENEFTELMIDEKTEHYLKEVEGCLGTETDIELILEGSANPEEEPGLSVGIQKDEAEGITLFCPQADMGVYSKDPSKALTLFRNILREEVSRLVYREKADMMAEEKYLEDIGYDER